MMPEGKTSVWSTDTENSSTKKDDTKQDKLGQLNIKVDDCRETRTVGNCYSQLYIEGSWLLPQYKMTQDNIEENICSQRAGDLAVQLGRGPE